MSAKQAEDFVEACTRQAFPNAWVLRMGSQQHPDFLVGSSSWEEELRRDSRLRQGTKVSKVVAEKWEASSLNPRGQRWVRLEVKTGSTVYTLNDTFPNPYPETDEVYVLFLLILRQVWVTTSATMAQEWKRGPPIQELYVRSKAAVKEFDSQLRQIWEGTTTVKTAARPTYRVGPDYAHRTPKAGVLESIFNKAGLPD